MRRGFKTRCEELAASARASLKLNARDKLCPFAYAKHLDIPVLFPKHLDLPAKHLRQLTIVDPGSWSGLTMRRGDSVMIVLNSAHARTRQVSTLMHEISHIALEHVPARVTVSDSGLLLLSEYDDEQEEEAAWLGGTRLLPRDALLAARGSGRTPEQIAAAYGVSKDLCVWRIRMTGVDARLHARRILS